MSISVLTAAEGGAWEATLVLAFDAGDHDVAVVRRCVDVVDLLAVGATGQAHAALVAATLRRLDADVVDRLTVAGVAVVGVYSSADVDAPERLHAMGIAHVITTEADPAVVASVVADAVRSQASAPTAALGYGDPFTASSAAIPPGESNWPPPPAIGRGSVVAVWGPTGAPGRSSVAMLVADELARLARPTLLLDGDSYGGVLASMLGLLDESPGIAAACRHAAVSRLDAAGLAALAWQISPSLRILTGLPRPQRWPELRPAALETVLSAARQLAEFTVVDCGFNLESDEELSFDTVAPRRNGATLTFLEQADLIVVVGAGDPIGMQRLVRGLADLRELDLAAPTWVVLNKVRTSAIPGNVGQELTTALERFAGRRPAGLLPFDVESVDAAMQLGKTLAEARPRSPLRTAGVELAQAIAQLRQPALLV